MKVGEIMTPNVISVSEDATSREVAQVLDRHRISGLPVCDDAGHMVGLISEFDLIAKPNAHTAGEAMTRDVISVMEDTSVDEVRYLLVHRRIKRVPVLRGQKLVGIVSRADLLRSLLGVLDAQPAEARRDEEILELIQAELAKRSWVPRDGHRKTPPALA